MTINDIVSKINDKIEIIILKEIDDYRIINNIDIILNYQRNYSYSYININNEEADIENEETNSEEISDEEEIDDCKSNKIILLKEKIKLNILKLNDICENSKLYKIFYKLTILNIFFINCYCNIFILRKVYTSFF